MCIITLEDKKGRVDVSATKIFARHTDPNHQLIVYGMSIATDSSAAMILPIPVKPESGEDAVRFIDMNPAKKQADPLIEDYFRTVPTIFSNFFADLEDICHPEYIPDPLQRLLGDGFFSGSDSGSTLKVHDVGGYEASYIPSKADFTRVDIRFLLKLDAPVFSS